MRRFDSNLNGNGGARGWREGAGLERLASGWLRTSGRREPPKELDESQVVSIQLPPSPWTWEVNGRDALHRELNHRATGPVFRAGFKNQHTKVVRLAAGLSEEQRQGKVGGVIARAYRQLIVRRMETGQLAAAAKHSVGMFERVPGDVQDGDRRRFNRILDQMDKAGKKHNHTRVHVASPSSEPLFSVSDRTVWTLDGERKLKSEERPNPAFEVAAIDGTGTWMLDRSGSSAGPAEVRSVLRRLDRRGCLVGERHLHHDAYRTGTGVGGSNIAIMDSNGGLHLYDARLNSVMEADLPKDPRVVDHFRTTDANHWGKFKSQVRSVDVAPEGDRYLFTLADEVWCCRTSGRTAWGVVMPLRKGWKRVFGRTERLAWARADRNLNGRSAVKRMNAPNRVFDVGVEPPGPARSDVTSFVRKAPDSVIHGNGIQISVELCGPPQDWVHAASFAADGGVYVATYSGKVLLLSQDGRLLVVYDIGTGPIKMVDIGRYAYFLTRTRLYVVKDRTQLAAILDVFQQGRLLVSPSGFGLLARKRLQWFTVAGVKVGELTTRHPIRAIHAVESGAVVQTRQHQVEVCRFEI